MTTRNSKTEWTLNEEEGEDRRFLFLTMRVHFDCFLDLVVLTCPIDFGMRYDSQEDKVAKRQNKKVTNVFMRELQARSGGNISEVAASVKEGKVKLD